MHRLTPLILALVIPSCGGEVSPAPPVVTDSVGIRLMEFHPEHLTRVRQLAAHPNFVIGGEGSGVDLFKVTDVTVLSSGVVVIANGDQQLLAFNSSGELRWTTGGTGEGPGEFRAITWVSLLPGDTLLVWSWADRRLTWFGPEGQLVRTASRSLPADGSPIDAFKDGSLLVRGTRGYRPSGRLQLTRDSVPLWRVTTEGDTIQFGQFPLEEGYLYPQGYAVHPFGRRTGWSVSPVTNQLALATGDAYTVALYGFAAGSLETLLRVQQAPVPATPGTWDDYFAAVAQTAPDREAATRALRSVYAEPLVPSHVPAYDSVLVTESGDVWAREWRMNPSDSARWVGFNVTDPDVYTVQIPAQLTLDVVSDSVVVGRWIDSVGLITVRSYDVAGGNGS